MNDPEQNLKAGSGATLSEVKPKMGKIGIWSSHVGVAL